MANTDDFQAISSPHYPGFYPEHLDITFIIYSPEGTNVKLTFLDFSIETDYYYDYSNCNYDQFIIYDGKYIIYFVKIKTNIRILNKDDEIQYGLESCE